MDLTGHIPLAISAVIIPAVGWLHRQLSKLAQESVEQEQKIGATNAWLKNLDAATARRAELEVLVARLEALMHRIERAESSIDKLRNGTSK
jgi:hypothetical protein